MIHEQEQLEQIQLPVAGTLVQTVPPTSEPQFDASVASDNAEVAAAAPAPETSQAVVATEEAAEAPQVKPSADGKLAKSPRWNQAAEQATAKGLKPNSREWIADIQENLRKQPGFDRRRKPSKGQRPDKPLAEGQRERRQRPEGQPNREAQHGPHGNDYSPGYVNYGAIISMLLKASRFRRNQMLRSRGQVKNTNELETYYAVSFGGPRQSGKTKTLFERFQRDWSTSIFVVPEEANRDALRQYIQVGMKEGQVNEMMKRVITADTVMDETDRYGTTVVTPRTNPRMSIEVDPEDPNPAATLSGYVATYMAEQKAWKEHTPPATHPVLLPLRTVYVDQMQDCEHEGMDFGYLARYLGLGDQLPEIIISRR